MAWLKGVFLSLKSLVLSCMTDLSLARQQRLRKLPEVRHNHCRWTGEQVIYCAGLLGGWELRAELKERPGSAKKPRIHNLIQHSCKLLCFKLATRRKEVTWTWPHRALLPGSQETSSNKRRKYTRPLLQPSTKLRVDFGIKKKTPFL